MRRQKIVKSLDGIASNFEKAQLSQKAAVLIAILHSIRSKIDKNELKGIDSRLNDQKKLTSSLMAGQIIDGLIQSRKSEAFSCLESYSQRWALQHKGVEFLANLFAKKLKTTMVMIYRSGTSVRESANSNLVQGFIAMDRFFLKQSLHFQYNFFMEGKKLFEEDRGRIPSSAKKAKLIKSPSLVVEVTQNFRYGFLELSQLVEKKMFAAFKYSLHYLALLNSSTKYLRTLRIRRSRLCAKD